MTEDRSCYSSPRQRDLLKVVAGSPLFQGFFLTGGTCLAVFYLHHRVSHDLDFFITGDLDLIEWSSDARALLRPQIIVAAARHFFSCVADGVKLDFVVDPLSGQGPRPTIMIDEIPVAVDRLDNIGPNKICALISRAAPKDAVDCYVLYRSSPERFMAEYRLARQREALLDDLMYAGERLQMLSEEAYSIVHGIGPDLRTAVDAQDLADFYAGLGDTLFRMGTDPGPPDWAGTPA